jgi:peptidoglycan hydrolase-like protein with peptidoglycan-binding domain
MKPTLIALAAAAALALPASAQQQPNASQNQSTEKGAADQGKQAQGAGMRLGRAQTRMLQTQLNRMGLDAGTVDGIMGAKSRAALEKFQSQKGLNPSGQLDQQTMAALRSLRGQSVSARRARQGEQPQPGSQPDQNAPK